MEEGTWLKQRKRNKLPWVIAGTVVVLAAAGIFLRNNSELLLKGKTSPKGDQSFSVSETDAASIEPAEKAGLQAKEKSSAQRPAVQPVAGNVPPVQVPPQPVPRQPSADQEPPVSAPAASLSPPAQQPAAAVKHVELGTTSLLLSGITCALMDRNKPKLRLSLELYFDDNPGFKKEILLKKDNLKVMVKKVLSVKALDDLVVETLRIELKNVLNGLLEKGTLTDIEFREFQIDKVE